VNRNNCGAAVWVANEVVTSFDANQLKADLPKCCNEIFACDTREFTHAAIVIL
jgi:hypothetical protein